MASKKQEKAVKTQPQGKKMRETKTREIEIILGLALSSTSSDKVLKAIEENFDKNIKFSLVTPNPEIVLVAQHNKRLRVFINQADFSLPDGVGLVWANRFLNGTKITRIPGRIFFKKLLYLAEQRALKVFLLGASAQVNEQAIHKIQSKYPNIVIEGTAGPKLDKNAKPVTLRNRKSYYDTLNHINKFKPDILFVAFGAPKQELFLADNLNDLQVGGAMVIGGTLDSFVGNKPEPPKMLSKLGLEWLWRLVYEPKRIGRILKATVVFPALVIKQKLTP